MDPTIQCWTCYNCSNLVPWLIYMAEYGMGWTIMQPWTINWLQDIKKAKNYIWPIDIFVEFLVTIILYMRVNFWKHIDAYNNMVHMLSKVIYVLEYIEPMYRGPSRGPCIGTIYPTLLGFGGIQATILSYPLLYTADIRNRSQLLLGMWNLVCLVQNRFI